MDLFNKTIRAAHITRGGNLIVLFSEGGGGFIRPHAVNKLTKNWSRRELEEIGFTAPEVHDILRGPPPTGGGIEITDELKRIGSSALRKIADILEREAAQ